MLSDFLMRNRYLSYHLVLLMDLFLSVLSTALSYLLVRYFSHGQLSGELLLPLVLVSAVLGLVSFLLLRTHHSSLVLQECVADGRRSPAQERFDIVLGNHSSRTVSHSFAFRPDGQSARFAHHVPASGGCSCSLTRCL